MAAEPEHMASRALAYARRGWPVFPCRADSKQPATRHGFHDATIEPDQIRWWWQRQPAANVAIATGVPGPDVLDVDDRGTAGNGFGAYDRLARAGLLRSAGDFVATPGGGLHVYFSGSYQPSGRLPRQHLDFKAVGGYVLAPPSHVDGRPYKLVTCSSLPSGGLDWRAATALLDSVRRLPTLSVPSATDDVGHLAAWVERLQEGNRNSGLFWAACRAVEAGRFSCLDELAAAAARTGLSKREISRTIASARRAVQRPAGMRAPEREPVR